MPAPRVATSVFILLLAVVAKWPLQVSSFWLTDSSLFQAPIQMVVPLQQQQQQASINKTQETLPETLTTNELLVARGEPWIKLGQDQQLQLKQQQQEQCQCNVDWIRNQTNSWLNKWLASSNVANQMRLLVSNSTGASGDINRRDASTSNAAKRTNESHAGSSIGNSSSSSNNNNNNNSNHWTAWTRSTKGNNEPGSAGGARTPTTRARGAQGSNQHHHQQQQQWQLKLAQGPRGPPGPKGETGARGDRGEAGQSGLARVKNRDALFDLPNLASSPNSIGRPLNSSTTDNGRPKLGNLSEAGGDLPIDRQKGALVFIESEQLLVVSTESGWRPVQLLPALRDFRKTIAKFSLTSPDDRRRLLQAHQSMDNPIKPIIMRSHGVGGSSAPSLRRTTTAARDLNADSPHREGSEQDDGELDVDEEEEDDDDEEEEEEEDDNEVEGGRDVEADKENQLEENGIRIGDENDERIGLNNNLDKGQVQKSQSRVQPPVSARSAAAALVSASIENSVTMGSPIKLESSSLRHPQPQASSRDGGERRLRLRLAALNEPFSGNVHGIRGADFECKRNAAKANVKGSFRAFLASGFQNLNEVVRYNVHKYPVVNLRGEILTNSWHDLFKQPAQTPNPLDRIYSFDGRHVATDSNWPNKLIWHGASNKAGYRDLLHNCDGWHSDSLSKFGLASPLHPIRNNQAARRRQRKRHLGQQKSIFMLQNGGSEMHQHGQVLDTIDKYPCRMPLIVLCIETIGQQSESITKNDEDTSNMLAN